MHDIWHWGVCRQRDTSLINGIFDLNTQGPIFLSVNLQLPEKSIIACGA